MLRVSVGLVLIFILLCLGNFPMWHSCMHKKNQSVGCPKIKPKIFETQISTWKQSPPICVALIFRILRYTSIQVLMNTNRVQHLYWSTVTFSSYFWHFRCEVRVIVIFGVPLAFPPGVREQLPWWLVCPRARNYRAKAWVLCNSQSCFRCFNKIQKKRKI